MFSVAELLVVLPRGWGTSLFLVPRVHGFWGWVAWKRRSAAGEWFLWCLLGGGPPHFWEVPGRPVVRWALPGGCAGRPARAVLGGFGGFLAAVDDDLLGLGCGVAPSDQLVEIVAVALVR